MYSYFIKTCPFLHYYLEPIYTTEDIANQMETESRLFKDVDRTFKNIIEMADTNPNVIHITETNGVLDMLTKSDKTVKDIIHFGLLSLF